MTEAKEGIEPIATAYPTAAVVAATARQDGFFPAMSIRQRERAGALALVRTAAVLLAGTALPFIAAGSVATAQSPPQQQAPSEYAGGSQGGQHDNTPAGPQRRVTLTFNAPGADEALTNALKGASPLSQLTEEATGDSGRILRAALAEQRALMAALFNAGHYQGVVTVTVAGAEPNSREARQAVESAFAQGDVPAVIDIEPGPLFRFGDLTVTASGGGPAIVGVGETGLVKGAPALANEVRVADGKLVEAMRKQGYPLARIADRTATADHASKELDVAFVVDPGRQATFGRVEVRGAKDMNPEFIAGRAPFTAGNQYRPQPLEDYARDLRELGAFDGVRVTTGETVDPDGSIPIIVEVTERKPRFFGAAAQWSTTEGALLSAWWGHRNLFGGAETIRIEGEVSRLFLNSYDDLEYRAGFTFTKPGIWTPRDSLVVANYFVREAPDAYTRTGYDGGISVVRKYGDARQYTIGLAPTFSQIDDVFGHHEYAYVGIVGEAKFDTTDNRLDPTRGYRLTVGVEPAFGSIESSWAMFAATATASTYIPLDEEGRFVAAGQVQLGSVIGPSLRDMPANERFYAGGGGSIRGYAYQSVSPRNRRDQITGGMSLLTASLELRAKITETIGIVPFVDVGSAFESSFPDFDPPVKIGAGLGLRYYTGIGPLRFDVAVPLDKEKDDDPFALYISLGQSF